MEQVAILRFAEALKRPSSGQAYAFATFAVATATLLRLLLNEWLDTDYVFGVFYVAVAISAWYCGLRAGLLAIVLSGGATLYVLAVGRSGFTFSVPDQVEWAIFLAFSVASTLLLESHDHARREAARVRETLSALIEAAPIGIALFDERMRYTLVNDALASLNGIPAADHVGKTPADLLPDVAPKVEGVFRQVMATGRSVSALEFEAQTPGTRGVKRVWLEAWFPVLDGRGRTHGVGALVQDITPQRAAEQALRDADQHKDHFLAMLSHELRNALGPLSTAWQVLQADLPAERHPQRGARGVLDRQLVQMKRLIEDLLDLSRISAGTFEVRIARMDLRDALHDALHANAALLEQHRHEVVQSIPAAAVFVDADRVRLAQVFGNILTNAAKYTHAGGRIDIVMSTHENTAEISIRDNGGGIAPDVLPTIFDMFIRAQHMQDNAADGMGIGLSIVKRIVELHGGTVEARSEGIDRGAEFIVRLPLADASA